MLAQGKVLHIRCPYWLLATAVHTVLLQDPWLAKRSLQDAKHCVEVLILAQEIHWFRVAGRPDGLHA